MSERGFTLLATLISLLLGGAATALVLIQATTLVEQTDMADRQMRALTVAQNGIEVGRHLLRSLEPDTLLQGADGISEDPPVRDPLPLQMVETLGPPWDVAWSQLPDDGLVPGSLLVPWLGSLSPDEHFFLRFSNDNAEGQLPDTDGVVLLRSLGVVSSRRGTVCSTLIEARFRKEKALLLPSAITAVGSLELQLSTDSSIEGSIPLITLLTDTPPATLELRDERVGPTSPISSDSVAPPEKHPRLRLLEPAYWEHFSRHLSQFTWIDGGAREGLFELDGTLAGEWSGVAVTRGAVRLSPDFSLRGLLIHLGPGELDLGGARIDGGVCLAALRETSLPNTLQMPPGSRVLWDGAELKRALERLPVALIGWRQLWPD